jgi:hypothetical protein
MWSEVLVGDHYSTDVAVAAGTAVWFSHARGMPGPQQTWDYWEVNALADVSLGSIITAFIKNHLPEYTGMLNIEIIGGKIIEVHLRFSEQWPDLYGSWFLPALVDLYAGKGWTGPALADGKAKTGYSVVLFDDEKYARQGSICDDKLRNVEALCGVSSVTMAYDPDLPLEICARPPGGFRIAWVNGFDLDRCFMARKMLQACLHELYDG